MSSNATLAFVPPYALGPFGPKMSGKSGSAPQSPDYASLIPAQKQANLDIFNTMLGASRANQSTPYGSSTWTSQFTPNSATSPAAQTKENFNGSAYLAANPDVAANSTFAADPYSHWTQYGQGEGRNFAYSPNAGTEQWTEAQTLSPEQQALYNKDVGSQLQMSDLLSGLGSRVADATSQPVDFGSAPALQTGMGMDPKAYSQEAADAVYKQGSRYLDPQQDIQRRQLEARLGDQGFVPGTPGYTQAMGEFQRNSDLAYGQARDQATSAGSAVGNQWFGNQLSANQLTNSSRQQAIAQMLTQRQYPLNELNALRAGTQVTNPTLNPTFSTPNLQGVDALGAANQNYQNQLGVYNADVSSGNATMGAAGSMAGMVAMYFL